MSGAAEGPTSDPQTAASVSLAWLIAANKPLYPLYVWWLTGHVWAGAISAISGLAYAALPFLARSNGGWARLGVPVLGMIDTVVAIKLFGPAAGGAFYLVPCVLLAGMALHRREVRWAVGLAVAGFVIAVLLHDRLGLPLFEWTLAQAAALSSLNLYSAAGLSVFIIWRFAGLSRG